ncbi:MAG: hypothetical protein JST00_37680 [Deltaproteobacteria bacterium]|nr:hypothetical protein [Deltaproteobacteria bacterium]
MVTSGVGCGYGEGGPARDVAETGEQGASATTGAESIERVADGLPRGLAMVAARGALHIAYVTRDGSRDRVVYRRRAGASGPFSEETVAIASETTLEGTGLALDPAGEPHVAFFDRGRILVARRAAAGGWSAELVDGGVGALIHPKPRLAIGSDGVEQLVYSAFATGPDGRSRATVKHAARGAVGFASSVVDFGAPPPGWTVETTGNAALALDAANQPHVCYELSRSVPAVSSASDLFYAKREIGGWAGELAERGGRRGGSCSIALDGGGRPVISHLDWGTYDLHVTRREGSGWSTHVVDADGAVGRFSSLAFDRSGGAHVAYVDEMSGMLKRARSPDAAGGWTVDDVLPAQAFAGGDMVGAIDDAPTSAPGGPGGPGGPGAQGVAPTAHFLLTRISGGSGGRGELIYLRRSR